MSVSLDSSRWTNTVTAPAWTSCWRLDSTEKGRGIQRGRGGEGRGGEGRGGREIRN